MNKLFQISLVAVGISLIAMLVAMVGMYYYPQEASIAFVVCFALTFVFVFITGYAAERME
jgi:ABC-type Mn2+/Zn2+ transport system permease subunit